MIAPVSQASKYTRDHYEEVEAQLDSLLEDLSNPASHQVYVQVVTHQILPFAERRVLYFANPFDRFLMKIHGHKQLVCAGNIYPFLSRVLSYERVAGRLGCVLFPSVETVVVTTLFIDELCAVLCELSRYPRVHPMFHSTRLVHNLCLRFASAGSRRKQHIFQMFTQSGVCDHALIVHPVAESAIWFFYEKDYSIDEWSERHEDVSLAIDAGLTLLTRCAAIGPTMQTLLVPNLLFLARHGWKTRYSGFLRHMLDGPSVQLVVELQRTGRLEPLIRKAFDPNLENHEGSEWHVIRRLLRKQWPARVRAVLKEGDLDECAVTMQTCPISLHPMRHPVVASDGHTYERDVLLEHLVRGGMVSPITRQPLLYILFPNFGCQMADRPV